MRFAHVASDDAGDQETIGHAYREDFGVRVEILGEDGIVE